MEREVIRRGAGRVFIQLPEGLKRFASRLASVVERVGAEAIVSVDPCFGACGLAVDEARALGADLIVHYGHTSLVASEIPTLYIEARIDLELRSLATVVERLEGCRRIGLATIVQHLDALEVLRKFLLESGFEVFIGRGRRTLYPGQVIGCDYGALRSVDDKVDCFVFLGGRFHGLGAQLSTSKPVIIFDPYEDRVYDLREEADRVLRRRWASILEARDAENFGVIVGLMPGQRNMVEAVRAKKLLEKKGKKAVLLAARYITPEALSGFREIEAFVNTACPRVSLDDSIRFEKPLITYRELLVMAGLLEWEKLCRGGWFGE